MLNQSHRHLFRTASSSVVAIVLAATVVPGSGAGAQWVATYRQSFLPAPYNGAFARRFATADQLFNAADVARSLIYENLWKKAGAASTAIETATLDHVNRDVFEHPPRLASDTRMIAPSYAMLVPEVVATLDWGRLFRRQLHDVLADESMTPADRNGRVEELVAYYRSRRDLALAAVPKTPDLVDGASYALGFRRRYPRLNALTWATQWLDAATLEPLVVAKGHAERTRLTDGIVSRFQSMTRGGPDAAPHRPPFTPGIAPEFARQYPDAAAILDNLHLLEDALVDILVSPEVPRSAKRQESLRAAGAFRGDSAFVVGYMEWIRTGEIFGVENMGGPALIVSSAAASATVPRGGSIAGLLPAKTPSTAAADMKGMPGMTPGGSDMAGMAGMAGMPTADSTLRALVAIYQRMMADPVIRERVATDPILQRMLSSVASVVGPPAGAASMPGMPMPGMPNMPGMPPSSGTTPSPSGMPNMPGMPSMSGMANAMVSGTPAERCQAIDFVVRLLSDPAVEARIHQYPELHSLWSDPEVQRRLAELRRSPGAGGKNAPEASGSTSSSRSGDRPRC